VVSAHSSAFSRSTSSFGPTLLLLQRREGGDRGFPHRRGRFQEPFTSAPGAASRPGERGLQANRYSADPQRHADVPLPDAAVDDEDHPEVLSDHHTPRISTALLHSAADPPPTLPQLGPSAGPIPELTHQPLTRLDNEADGIIAYFK
jgi:hypothetical protein